MISTGIKREEACNLCWSDIDFENHIISVFGKKRKVASIPITSKLRKEFADYNLYCQS
jgi:integrase/recombinase XerD